MIPFHVLDLDKNDVKMLQERLYPEANELFLQTLAERQGLNPKHLMRLDYTEHPVYKRDRMIATRIRKAQYLKGQDTSKHNVKYKTIEEAKEKDKEGGHILLSEPTPLEELEAQFPIEGMEKMSIKETVMTQEEEKEDV